MENKTVNCTGTAASSIRVPYYSAVPVQFTVLFSMDFGVAQICGHVSIVQLRPFFFFFSRDLHSYGDPYFGRAYSSIFSTVFGTCSTDLHTDFAHRKSMKLHRFLMSTIFHIYNVTVVASVVIQFDTKIRKTQHIYNTLLVNTTTWYFLLVLDPAGTQITQPHSHTKGRQC